MKYLGSYMYNYNILYSFMFPPGPALTRNLKSWFIPLPPPPYALSPPAQNYICFPRKASEWGKWFEEQGAALAAQIKPRSGTCSRTS